MAPPPVDSTIGPSLMASRMTSSSMARNLASPAMSKISVMLMPAAASTRASLSTKGRSSSRASRLPTSDLPLPIMPTSVTGRSSACLTCAGSGLAFDLSAMRRILPDLPGCCNHRGRENRRVARLPYYRHILALEPIIPDPVGSRRCKHLSQGDAPGGLSGQIPESDSRGGMAERI